nr:unnamed protein product [Spirometra erinaceieuropaei]
MDGKEETEGQVSWETKRTNRFHLQHESDRRMCLIYCILQGSYVCFCGGGGGGGDDDDDDDDDDGGGGGDDDGGGGGDCNDIINVATVMSELIDLIA